MILTKAAANDDPAHDLGEIKVGDRFVVDRGVLRRARDGDEGPFLTVTDLPFENTVKLEMREGPE